MKYSAVWIQWTLDIVYSRYSENPKFLYGVKKNFPWYHIGWRQHLLFYYFTSVAWVLAEYWKFEYLLSKMVLLFFKVFFSMIYIALSWWTMIRLLLFVYRISPKTLGKQIVVFHSELTVLRCSSGTVANWPVLAKKQATICFEVFLPRTPFLRFGSSAKTHTVEYCIVLGLYV